MQRELMANSSFGATMVGTVLTVMVAGCSNSPNSRGSRERTESTSSAISSTPKPIGYVVARASAQCQIHPVGQSTPSGDALADEQGIVRFFAPPNYYTPKPGNATYQPQSAEFIVERQCANGSNPCNNFEPLANFGDVQMQGEAMDINYNWHDYATENYFVMDMKNSSDQLLAYGTVVDGVDTNGVGFVQAQ
jgi:hypothetical protein